MKSGGDFPVGHAGTLIEVDGGGLSVGAELALGGAGGVAGLQRMPAAHVLAAPLAVAAVDVELANDGLAWNLGLELLVEVVLDDVAAAIGTLLGQGSFERCIDLGGRRRLAMSVPTVLVALLAA